MITVILCVPVSMASTEQSFFAEIQIWLTVGQEGLTGLVIIAFKCDTACSLGTAVAQWLRCCATNQKVTGSIPASVSGIFH